MSQSFTRPSAVGYAHQGAVIPLLVAQALDRWISKGELPGNFLQAVLRNDLRAALGLADAQSKPALHTIVVYLYNEAPSPCWGSAENIAGWAASFQSPESALERRQQQIEQAQASAVREARQAGDGSDPEDGRLSNLPHDA